MAGSIFRYARRLPTSVGGRWAWLRVAITRTAPRAVLVAAAIAIAGRAGIAAPATVSERDLQAKLSYCETCHGASGQGFHGYYPIPRLAGQQPDYIANQLQAFIEHRRTNNIMFNVAHVLSPEMVAALAQKFHDLNPPPLGGAPKDLREAGKKIFEEGIPDKEVPACSSCHGPEAKGDGQFPRLAGQLHDYVFQKLTNFSKERGQNPDKPDTSAIMQPIAHALTEPEVKAVAAYLNYLE
jgi:cytochrome c553